MRGEGAGRVAEEDLFTRFGVDSLGSQRRAHDGAAQGERFDDFHPRSGSESDGRDADRCLSHGGGQIFDKAGGNSPRRGANARFQLAADATDELQLAIGYRLANNRPDFIQHPAQSVDIR